MEDSILIENDKADILSDISLKKYFTIKSIVIASFFCFLASGYMIYKNFKLAGANRKAALSIVFHVLFFALLMLASLQPTLDRIPSVIYSILFTLLTSVLVSRYQRKIIEDEIDSGARYRSTAAVFAICAIGLLIIAALLLGLYYAADELTR